MTTYVEYFKKQKLKKSYTISELKDLICGVGISSMTFWEVLPILQSGGLVQSINDNLYCINIER